MESETNYTTPKMYKINGKNFQEFIIRTSSFPAKHNSIDKLFN